VADPGMHNETPTVTTMKASDTSALVDHEHVHNVETRCTVPRNFLSLDFQCRDNVSELKQTFRD